MIRPSRDRWGEAWSSGFREVCLQKKSHGIDTDGADHLTQPPSEVKQVSPEGRAAAANTDVQKDR